jgi:energy-coupling factor transporter ATP-binding protein EcfA2
VSTELPISVSVEALTFSGGDTVRLAQGSTVLIVGPNNSGKTSTLREVHSALAGERQGPVLSTVKSVKQGTADDLKQWLDASVALVKNHLGEHAYSWLGAECRANGYQNYRSTWSGQALGSLSNILCTYLSVDERFKHVSREDDFRRSVRAFNVLNDAPQSPAEVLLRSEQIEERVSAFFHRAFGADLILNRGAGTDIDLHCGTRPVPQGDEDRLSHSFVGRVAALPYVADQGHGMRSYAGCLLAMATSPSLVQLIDEPEAFLHPAQARAMGHLLVAEKPPWRQLVIATHSGDLIRGVLETDLDNVHIIRLTRDGQYNRAHTLAPADIRALWSDPILRFSNVLDGLFHQSVIVCEGDSDCRFYAAMLETIHTSSEALPDVLFSASGGKNRMPTVVSSLVGLGVPTKIIADFDLLREEQLLRKIVESIGGRWSEIVQDWMETRKAIDHKVPPLTRHQAKVEIDKIMDASSQSTLTEAEVQGIRSALRRTDPWEFAKMAGLNALPSGQPRQHAESLLGSLDALGIFVVPCGELEKFVPSIGGESARWVAEVLKKDLANDAAIEDARKFVAKVFSVAPGKPRSPAKVLRLQTPNTISRGFRYHLRQILFHLSSLARMNK